MFRIQAIPLAAFAARSQSRVLAILTPDLGQIRVISRFSRQKSSPSPLHLFYTHDLLLEHPRRGTDLFSIKENEILKRREKLTGGLVPDSWLAVSCLAEILLHTTPIGEPQDFCFRMLDKVLDCFEGGIASRPLIISFLVKYLELIGIRPDFALPSGRLTGAFSIPLGRMMSHSEQQEKDPEHLPVFNLTAAETRVLGQCRLARFEKVEQTFGVPLDIQKLVDLMIRYLEYHLELTIKSAGVWKEMRLPNRSIDEED